MKTPLVLAAWLLSPAAPMAQVALQPSTVMHALPPACMAQANEILRASGALHDGMHKTGLPRVDDAVARMLPTSGVTRGWVGLSLITPPSIHRLVELAAQPDDEPDAACPLHRIYLAFSQGGAALQGARYFGPLLRKGAEVLTASP
jgi:hypothetical protein